MSLVVVSSLDVTVAALKPLVKAAGSGHLDDALVRALIVFAIVMFVLGIFFGMVGGIAAVVWMNRLGEKVRDRSDDPPCTETASVHMDLTNTTACFVTVAKPGKVHLFTNCAGLNRAHAVKTLHPCLHCLRMKQDLQGKQKLQKKGG